MEFSEDPRTGAVIQGGKVVFPPPTLEQVRQDRRAQANAYRDRRQNGGCVTALGRVDTDFQRSMTIINSIGAAASAAIAAKIAFGAKKLTLANGTQIALGATQGAQLGVTVNAFLDQCQDACLAVKAKIDAATSLEAVAAIDITAGYPA